MLIRPSVVIAAVLGTIACQSEAPPQSTASPANPPTRSTPAHAPARLLVAGDTVPPAVLAGAHHWTRAGAAGSPILVISFDRHDQRLQQLHDRVRSAPVLKGSVGLLTLSADPADMPAVLRAHADRIGADPEVWRFAALAPD